MNAGHKGAEQRTGSDQGEVAAVGIRGDKDCVGIDLGTTNSALTYWCDDQNTWQTLEVAQLVDAGRVANLTTLPSYLYLPHAGELAPGDDRLPWDVDSSDNGMRPPRPVIGAWARDRGTVVPERLVASAKSWLGQVQVDRHGAILPWRAASDAVKLSPVAASAAYLRYLLAAYQHQRTGVELTTAATVVLAVPASFDEVARSLTVEAAGLAGIERPILIEEPLAAFYAWLGANERNWREQVQPGDVVLVCDVGGGTTDFSMIAVNADAQGQLSLDRVSVGDHLLLGGDNMDLALAHGLKRKFEDQGKTIDHWQFLSLVSAARAAKERLLSDADVEELPIAIAGRGASLFGGALSTTLTRAAVESTSVGGFMPRTPLHELPKGRRSVGIQEFGLAYESDPAITRHLARFLKRSWQNARGSASLSALTANRLRDQDQVLMPSVVLFNGGVFKSAALRHRILDVLQEWNGGEPVRELTTPSAPKGERELDLAVARGAAYYGRLRQTGRGVRVQSGTARSYYVGLEEPAPAVPGFEPPVKGLCLVPQGTDEGTELRLSGQRFGLVVGEPVEFRFFSSAVRSGDRTGTVVEDAVSCLEESASLSLTLPEEGNQAGQIVPVELDACINAVGVLELYMKDLGSARRWHLEFNVRPHEY